jgi:hypothetical protein
VTPEADRVVRARLRLLSFPLSRVAPSRHLSPPSPSGPFWVPHQILRPLLGLLDSMSVRTYCLVPPGSSPRGTLARQPAGQIQTGRFHLPGSCPLRDPLPLVVTDSLGADTPRYRLSRPVRVRPYWGGHPTNPSMFVLAALSGSGRIGAVTRPPRSVPLPVRDSGSSLCPLTR